MNAPTLAEPAVGHRRTPPRVRMTPRTIAHFRRDPLNFLQTIGSRSDLVRFRLAGLTDSYLVNDPAAIHELLTVHHRRTHKSETVKQANEILGQGLLSSEDELHAKQRRIIQRGFSKAHFEHYGREMQAAILATEARWRDGEVVDLQPELYRLALQVAARSLFSTDVGDRAVELNAALSEALRWVGRLTFPFSAAWRGLPLPWLRSYRSNVRFLRASVDEIIEERRRLDAPPEDVFAILSRAQADGAEHLTDELISDEVVTLLFAGHESTASTLAWACLLLAFHPEAQEAAHAELEHVLGGEPPSPDCVDELELVGRVVHEALRLYPPVWLFGRKAVEEIELGPYAVGKGSTLLVSAWVTHRDERWWPRPDTFDLDRWSAEARAGRPRYSFFPFGGGPRVCIGAGFAMLEAGLTLAHVLHRWRLHPVDASPPAPSPWMTLRPGGPCRVRLEARR